MKKTLIIDSCKDYKHFDYEYFEYNEVCEILDRKISISYDGGPLFPIPTDCHLKGYNELPP